jgi:hypothetical protein
MKYSQISLADYLSLIDPERREYADEYLAWKKKGCSGPRPEPSRMSPQSARLLRHRLDQMLHGKPTFYTTRWNDRTRHWQRAEW